MATKKKAAKALPTVLKFKIEWIKDPIPDLRKILDRVQLRQLEAAKKDFGKRVNEILKR